MIKNINNMRLKLSFVPIALMEHDKNLSSSVTDSALECAEHPRVGA
ncbi:MAG: hypothetical protein Q7J35_18000 [Candidatus Methanoperedens sp.]|nr:hypothetical protein [Candidatus Methanoperedens sp.]